MPTSEESKIRSPARRPDARPRAIALTIAGVLIGGLVIARYDDIVGAATSLRMRGHVEMQRRSELDQRFNQGVVMLHARKYDDAAQAFHRVLQLAPKLPEAHVNMGFALVGLKQWPAAHDFFATAIELNPEQANAYYGLAIALEGLADLPGALGAMQTYLHRGPADDPYRRKAESAIWEWRTQLAQAESTAPGADASTGTSPETADPDSQRRESSTADDTR